MKQAYQMYQRGFTLIELLVVVAVIGILMAIAIPSYDNYMVNARRSEAKGILLQAALWMERNQSTSFAYDKDAAGVVLTPATALSGQGLGQSPLSGAAIYTIVLVNLTATTFEITATPIAGSKQASKDSQCGVLVINHLGQKGTKIGGTSDYTSAQAASCWSS